MRVMIVVNMLSHIGVFALLLMPFNDAYRQQSPFTSFNVELNGADVLHLRSSFVDITIDIIDVSGKILHKMQVAVFTTDIPVGQLSNGIYFVRVRYDNNKQSVEKFVKD